MEFFVVVSKLLWIISSYSFDWNAQQRAQEIIKQRILVKDRTYVSKNFCAIFLSSTSLMNSFMSRIMMKDFFSQYTRHRSHTVLHTTHYNCHRRSTEVSGMSLNQWSNLCRYSCIFKIIQFIIFQSNIHKLIFKTYDFLVESVMARKKLWNLFGHSLLNINTIA